MQQSEALEMLKRIRDEHDRTPMTNNSLGYYVAQRMPRIREIIHQLEELDPDEIREADES